jgi:predicted transcriptional regulator
MENKIYDNRKHNFTIIDNEVFDNYDLNPYELAVYFCFCRMSNNSTGSCFPSLQTIATKTKMSKPKVITSINGLMGKGLVEKTSRYREKKHISNLYAIKEVTKGVVNDIDHPSKRHLLGMVNDVDTNYTNINYTNITNKDTSKKDEFVYEDSANFGKKSPSYKKDKKTPSKKREYSTDVELIYSQYPPYCGGRGQSTGKTWRCKEKIKKLLVEYPVNVIQGVQAQYVESCGKGYLKNYSTYLNYLLDLDKVELVEKPVEKSLYRDFSKCAMEDF